MLRTTALGLQRFKYMLFELIRSFLLKYVGREQGENVGEGSRRSHLVVDTVVRRAADHGTKRQLGIAARSGGNTPADLGAT